MFMRKQNSFNLWFHFDTTSNKYINKSDLVYILDVYSYWLICPSDYFVGGKWE